MRKFFALTTLCISAQLNAQFFVSQLAQSNPAYTAMYDDHFADLTYSGFGISNLFVFHYLNASYQQNFAKINSGLGIQMGYSYARVDDRIFRASNTGLNYRYSHQFENGLRLATGTRIHMNFADFPIGDSLNNFKEIRNFGASLGTMAAYKSFSFGLTFPVFNTYKPNRWVSLQASYDQRLSSKVSLTTTANVMFISSSGFANLRAKFDFKDKFWLASGLNTVNLLGDEERLTYRGLYFGYRVFKSLQLYTGTDFRISRWAGFQLMNPHIGLVFLPIKAEKNVLKPTLND